MRLLSLCSLVLLAGSLHAQQNPPVVAIDSDPGFLKLPADMNFGELIGIAINSKGHIVVINHPGTYGGPLYGAASTQILEFDPAGRYMREIGHGVYGLGYAHSLRFDKYDNMWIVDKGTNSVMRFNPAGRVTMNLGRREEGPDQHRYIEFARGDKPPTPVDGHFHGATDIAFDSDDNMYISDGYFNSRIAKLDKHGYWIKSWGSRGREPGQFNLPHNIATDRQNNIYVADRYNRRIQVFNTNGEYLRSIVLNAPYDKTRHPVLGNAFANAPDNTEPWGLCITNTPTQYIYTADQEPGRIYKLTLDGKIVAMFGRSGHEVGEFNWVHAIACPSENTVYIADMNNWRVQKVTLHPEKTIK
jgi:hypothetical protein